MAASPCENASFRHLLMSVVNRRRSGDRDWRKKWGLLQKAQLIRQYVAEVGRHLESAPAPSAEAFKEWSGWALAQADRIDPVRNGSFLERIEDEDLDDDEDA